MRTDGTARPPFARGYGGSVEVQGRGGRWPMTRFSRMLTSCSHGFRHESVRGHREDDDPGPKGHSVVPPSHTPGCSVVAPWHPRAALRDLLLAQPGQTTEVATNVRRLRNR